MKRPPDTADELLKLRAELRKRYRVRQSVAGPVRQQIESARSARGENRKTTLRKLTSLNEHLAEYKWFHRLVTMATQLYLATGRIDERLAIMAAWCKTAHEAKYPGWIVTAPPPRSSKVASAQGVGSMILTALQSGTPALLPPGPLVERLNASMIKHPHNEQEREIVSAARKRVRQRFAGIARVGAQQRKTTTVRARSRAAEARALRTQGLSQLEIAKRMGVSERQVRRWLTGK